MNNLFAYQENSDLSTWSPLILAYIGDAVFELMVRLKNVNTCKSKVGDLHSETVKLVSAPTQALLLKAIMEELTESEYFVVRRGKNAKIHQPPKGVKYWEYRFSTALEALVGYLYLQGQDDRIQDLILEELEKIDLDVSN